MIVYKSSTHTHFTFEGAVNSITINSEFDIWYNEETLTKISTIIRRSKTHLMKEHRGGSSDMGDIVRAIKKLYRTISIGWQGCSKNEYKKYDHKIVRRKCKKKITDINLFEVF